jgi:hypothetical protein
VAAAPTGILNSFTAMHGHGSGSILRNRNDIALRCDDESRSLTPPLAGCIKNGINVIENTERQNERQQTYRMSGIDMSTTRNEWRRDATPLWYTFALRLW